MYWAGIYTRTEAANSDDAKATVNAARHVIFETRTCFRKSVAQFCIEMCPATDCASEKL